MSADLWASGKLRYAAAVIPQIKGDSWTGWKEGDGKEDTGWIWRGEADALRRTYCNEADVSWTSEDASILR